tara:strand:- start:232 stop:801 length:570 start_codon:yes stop_codon:yes gene_type:complete
VKSKRVVIFNAPPNAGKDVCAKYCTDNNPSASHKEFKKVLFDVAKAIAQISDGEWDLLYTRERKEQPTDRLFGMSPREWMIHTSESVIKPVFGKKYFGDAMALSLADGINYVSDGGFIEELYPVLAIAEVLILRIHRDGCTFEGDSRNYLPDNIEGAKVLDIENNSTLEDLFFTVDTEVNKWLLSLEIL